MKSKSVVPQHSSPQPEVNPYERMHYHFSVENDPLPGEQDQDYLPVRLRRPEPLRPMDFDRPSW
ncbi:hypothetical protein LGH70_16175 [Hymenobacter sp. BT635]|uniref:Uncharacterized protein n=1 Tax=Hymenobacter nitidus TaxID=2880929 RepID=A0ABS8AGC5_9BACT|nr:hypothetical protein [Hymenobacter nitidus]MCB2379139.1 hypothetical protein [Hymenobacter nitidus]